MARIEEVDANEVEHITEVSTEEAQKVEEVEKSISAMSVNESKESMETAVTAASGETAVTAASGTVVTKESIDTPSEPEKKGFYYVYIPADVSQPIEELKHTDPVELQSDSFIDMVKNYFGKHGKDVNTEMLRKQIEQRSKQKIDDQTMAALNMVNAVDIFPILLPLKDTKFEGVSCYVDDKGIAKGLTVNPRLTQMVKAAGYPDQVFHGDAFVGKVFDDQDAWERIDFRISECSSDAPWVQLTHHQRKQSANRNASGNGLSALKDQMASAQNPALGMNAMPTGPQAQLGDNGLAAGDEENYTWNDRDDEEIEVIFKPEAYVEGENKEEKAENAKKMMAGQLPSLSKKDVQVSFPASQKGHLVVKVRGKELMNAELFHGVDRECCTWSIVDKNSLVLTVMKKTQGRWRTLVK